MNFLLYSLCLISLLPLLVRSQCTSTAKLDILFAIDTSSSVIHEDFESLKQFLNTLVLEDINTDDSRVGFALFSTDVDFSRSIEEWQQQELHDYIAALSPNGGYTNTRQLVADAVLEFKGERSNSTFVPDANREQVIIMVTDGNPCTEHASNNSFCPDHLCGGDHYGEQLSDLGIRSVIVAVGDEVYPPFINCLCSSTDDFLPISDYSKWSFESIKHSLSHVLCPQRKPKLDILFAIDSSSSVGDEGFESVKQFLNALLQGVNTDDHRIGFALFSTDVAFSRSIQRWDPNALQEYVDSLSWNGGWSNTRQLIADVLLEFEGQRTGSTFVPDANRDQVLIVITDGNPCTPGECPDSICPYAAQVPHLGIRGIVVAVGSDIESKSVDCLCDTKEDFISMDDFSVSSFNTIMPQLADALSIETARCTSSAQLDIVFAIDSSGSMARDAIDSVKQFIQTLVREDINVDASRIGFATFASDVVFAASIQQWQQQEQLQKQIDSLVFDAGWSNTRQLVDDVLREFEGQTRSETEKVLVMVTDGNPCLPLEFGGCPQSICPDAAKLNDFGIRSVIVALDDLNRSNIDCVIDREHDFISLSDFNTASFESIHSSLSDVLCPQPTEMDILFAMDSSGSIGYEGFETMKQFLNALLEGINTDESRIGFAQFATEVDFSRSIESWDHDALQAYVDSLSWSGGYTNTQQVVKEALLEFEGQRSESTFVPDVNRQQMFIMITDGDPCQAEVCPQSICPYGAQLSALGIRGIVVAVGNTYTATNIDCLCHRNDDFISIPDYSVSSFNSIMPQLADVLSIAHVPTILIQEPPATQCASTTELDILFAIDTSGSIGYDDWHNIDDFLYTLVLEEINIFTSRIGFATFSTEVTFTSSIQQWQEQDDIQQHITSLVYDGGYTNTHQLVQDALLEFQGQRTGSKFVPDANREQILIMITDGNPCLPPSSGGECPESICPYAAKLNDLGIRGIIVAIGDTIEAQYMDCLCDKNDDFLSIPDFSESSFESIQDALSDVLCPQSDVLLNEANVLLNEADDDEERIKSYVVVIAVCLIVVLIVGFVYYRKRKNEMVHWREEIQDDDDESVEISVEKAVVDGEKEHMTTPITTTTN